MLDRVTAFSEAGLPPSEKQSTPQLVPESQASRAARTRAAAGLRAEAFQLARRWAEQSRTVALREPREPGSADDHMMASIIESLADHLGASETTDDLVALGLALGADAFECDRSLHHTLKGLDLLAAMALHAVEAALADETSASAADGVRLSRRLQETVSLLTRAATRGYTQTMSEAMRERFRHLRHDLRNPLGTIKSVLAMMDDETMPAEARAHPRFRAMAKRNARSLGDLISDRLSDTAATAPPLTQQRASLRTIACTVRRDLRAQARERGATVAVGSDPARVMADAVALELLLHEVLLAALHEAREGDEIDIRFEEARAGHVDVSLLSVPPRCIIADTSVLDRLGSLARRMGAQLQVADLTVTLVIPATRVDGVARGPEQVASLADAGGPADATPTADPSGDREPGYDIRHPREREHGESRPL
jgi:signal transduction histidine kinase